MALANLKLLNEDLVAKGVSLVKDLDLRLVLIDASEDVDKFYRLQGLTDGSQFYCFAYWGDTGGRGAQLSRKLWGPFSESSMRGQVDALFEQQTGRKVEEMKAGDRALPGKYWLQQKVEEEEEKSSWRWEYYVDDGVDGKSRGWHPYEEDASDEVEQLYLQHMANDAESRTAQRVVSSGYFSYKVDLQKMTQQNTKTKKIRQIRRTEEPVLKLKKVRKEVVSKPAKTSARKAPKKSAVKPRAMKVKKLVLKKGKAKKVPKKVMKVVKVSIIAKGKGAKSKVWRGKKEKTSTGLKKCDLKKNMDGKLVSKKHSEAGRKAFAHVACWIAACKQARAELGLTGFVAVKKGTPLYNKAKELYPTAKPHVLK